MSVIIRRDGPEVEIFAFDDGETPVKRADRTIRVENDVHAEGKTVNT